MLLFFFHFHSNWNYMACLVKVFKLYCKVFGFFTKYCYPPFSAIKQWEKGTTNSVFFSNNNVFISTVCFLQKYYIKFWVAESLGNSFSFVVIWRPPTFRDGISNYIRSDTRMMSTLRGVRGGLRQKLDVIGFWVWGFSKCSGRPIFVFFN